MGIFFWAVLLLGNIDPALLPKEGITIDESPSVGTTERKLSKTVEGVLISRGFQILARNVRLKDERRKLILAEFDFIVVDSKGSYFIVEMKEQLVDSKKTRKQMQRLMSYVLDPARSPLQNFLSGLFVFTPTPLHYVPREWQNSKVQFISDSARSECIADIRTFERQRLAVNHRR